MPYTVLAWQRAKRRKEVILTHPDQFISPELWSAIKQTVAVLTEAETLNVDNELPGWFFELRDQLTQMIVATSFPVEPFPVSEHFCYLLDMYVAGAALQENVADGTKLVIDWARQALRTTAEMGIKPKRDGKECVWLVIHAMPDGGK